MNKLTKSQPLLITLMLFWSFIATSVPLSAIHESGFIKLIDIECDPKNTFYQSGFDRSCRSPIGHLLKLSINNQEIAADTEVRDPQDPYKKLMAVGAMEMVNWNGRPTDPIYFALRMSPSGKAQLQEILCTSLDMPKIEAEWIVYDYDYDQDQYFPCFHTNGKSVSLAIKKDSEVYISQSSDSWKVTNPVNFSVRVLLDADPSSEDQHLFAAFRVNGKTISLPFKAPIEEENIKN